jgi:hypothetical protein
MEKTFEELKKEIDGMTHEEMCRIWRFGSDRREFTDGTNPASQYFSDRLFKHFGGFTPEISKRTGWEQ